MRKQTPPFTIPMASGGVVYSHLLRVPMLLRDIEGGDQFELRLDVPLPAGTTLKIRYKKIHGKLRAIIEIPDSVTLIHRSKSKKLPEKTPHLGKVLPQ